MKWKNGPVGLLPDDAEYLNPELLVDRYRWVEVRLPDDENRFSAAYWVSQNCGEEFTDFFYYPVDRWCFRNHEAAAMFKLMFG
jgi:hypothetical protein